MKQKLKFQKLFIWGFKLKKKLTKILTNNL